MKRYIKHTAAALAGALLLTGSTAVAADTQAAANDWVLTWSDEFDGTTVDESKWGFDTGNWIRDAKGNLVTGGWGNNEKEYYQKENAAVSDGLLTITARQETVQDPAQGNYDYTSAKLLTKGKFSTCYGKIEVRAKMDTGASLWPAIWMLPEEEVYGGWAASGELDIMEGWGSRPADLCGTIHFGDVWPGNTYLTSNYTLPDSTVSDWHTYAVEWEADEIRWYADDVLFGTQNRWNSANRPFPAPFDQNFYLILNLAVGGHFDGVGDGTQVDPALFANGAEKKMQVDYVRVYHKNGEITTPITPTQPAMKLYTMDGGGATLQNFNDRAEATVTATGTETYSVMLTKESLTLQAGVPYDISFSLSSTEARSALVTLEDAAYQRFLSEAITARTTPTDYSFRFTPEADMTADFKLQLGNMSDSAPAVPHTVTLAGLSVRPACAVIDLNGDGACTGADYALLCDFVHGRAVSSLPDAADCNKDGCIDAADLTVLKRRLLTR